MNKPLLEDLVIEDMKANGWNPENPTDVLFYWTLRLPLQDYEYADLHIPE